MLPSKTALTQLRDIHMPNPVGWWPLASGWYLLMVLVCLALFGITFLTIRHIINGRIKRQALSVLESYQQEYLKQRNSQLSAARISELLKRVALVYYPRKRVASLQGKAWIDFLNQTAQQVDFNSVSSLLIECPYQPQKLYCAESQTEVFSKPLKAMDGFQEQHGCVLRVWKKPQFVTQHSIDDLLPLFILAKTWIKQRRGRCLN